MFLRGGRRGDLVGGRFRGMRLDFEGLVVGDLDIETSEDVLNGRRSKRKMLCDTHRHEPHESHWLAYYPPHPTDIPTSPSNPPGPSSPATIRGSAASTRVSNTCSPHRWDSSYKSSRRSDPPLVAPSPTRPSRGWWLLMTGPGR